MLRSFFIYLSKAGWARNLVMNWSIAWRMASRFVAGEKLEDAINAIKDLNERGINATIDHLGEHTSTRDEAIQATEDILTALGAIDRSKVHSNVSVKLTQIGLNVDPLLCAENLEKILNYAAESDNYIRVDMEDSQVTQQTLDLICQLRNKGYDNVGTVIQAYLYRSEADVRSLAGDGISIRLCKGAYKEPAQVAFPNKKDVDRNYDHLTTILIDAAIQNGSPQVSNDGRFPPIPVIASHDSLRINFAKESANEKGLPKSSIEFQMLHGIRRELQERLTRDGYPVRVYVPYGTEWYPYYMRRLAERPANVWFFIVNFFRK
jgi:proline dehydrogenase